jgi:hypothetical protein
VPTHELKAWPEPFAGVLSGEKPFEWRKDDRTPPYAVGDILHLREFAPCPECHGSGRVRSNDGREGEDCGCAKPHGEYTGRDVFTRVTWVLRDAFDMPEGFVVLGVKKMRRHH